MSVDYFVKQQVLEAIRHGSSDKTDIAKATGLPSDLVDDALWELTREKKVRQDNEQLFLED